MHRRLLVAGVCVLIVVGGAFLVSGCGKKTTADEEVLARVNGVAITRGQLVQFLERQDGGTALEELISRELIKAKAKERGITASDEEINRRMAIREDTTLMKTGVPFVQWVKDNGQSVDDSRETERVQVLTAKLAIPPSVEKSFFEANKDQLKALPYNAESVIYRQIIVGSKAEAEAVAKQVAGAKDKELAFAELAKEKSLDPVTRACGGMPNPMFKGQTMPAEKELEKALFSLSPGQVSAPLAFETPSAGPGSPAPTQWQVVMVVKRYSAHPMRLEDNEDMIEQAILQGKTNDPQVMKAAMEAQQLFSSLPAKASIEILSPRYKALGDWFKEQKETAARAQTSGGAMGGPGGAVPSTSAPAPTGK